MRRTTHGFRWITAGLALASLLAVASGASGHEGHRHEAMGTVTMVHEDHLMMTTTDDEKRTFVLSESTKYVRGEEATTKDDVATGERAVITYETRDGADHALEVRLGKKEP